MATRYALRRAELTRHQSPDIERLGKFLGGWYAAVFRLIEMKGLIQPSVTPRRITGPHRNCGLVLLREIDTDVGVGGKSFEGGVHDRA